MAINTWAVSVLRYGAGIINWTKAELESMDRKARKRLTIYEMLHPRANVDRLYLPRGCGGRGVISVEDCVRVENGLTNYVQTGTNKPLLVSVNHEGLPMNKEGAIPKKLKERRNLDRLERWKNKPLHGQFLRQIYEVYRGEASWAWLNKGDLKKEPEGLITAAQDQALRTNAMKAKIEKQDLSPLCRMCGAKDETTHHLVCECSKLAQIEYKQRHDNVTRNVHWNLTKLHRLDVTDKWYDRKPEGVMESVLSKSMEYWKTELSSGGERLGI